MKKKTNLNWIMCSTKLPVEKTNPVTMDYYIYPVKAVIGNIEDIRFYSFGKGHWWHGPSVMDDYVVSWFDIHELENIKNDKEKC